MLNLYIFKFINELEVAICRGLSPPLFKDSLIKYSLYMSIYTFLDVKFFKGTVLIYAVWFVLV